jgi:protein-tyrosine phosphatase
MIDLHCHVLPRLDDGALDLEDSVAMARQAQADGIGTICARSHIRWDHDVAIEQIGARVDALQQELERRSVPVQIVPGGEVAQTAVERCESAQLRTLSLGGAGGWILLELAPGPLAAELLEPVRRIHEAGMGAIVAHPERHAGADLESLPPRPAMLSAVGDLAADRPAGRRARRRRSLAGRSSAASGD